MAGRTPVPFQNQDPDSKQNWVDQKKLYDNQLSTLQGTFGSDWQISLNRPVHADDLDDVKPGMLVHIHSSTNTFKKGADGTNLLYFVQPAGGYQGGVAPEGNVYGEGVLALPACVAYRMVTNVYDEDGTYAAGTPLTVDNDGELTDGTYYTDTIVGISVNGVRENWDAVNRDFLEFISYWLPAQPGD